MGACPHASWRRWRFTDRAAVWAYGTGIIAGSSRKWGDGCRGCVRHISWRGRRVYAFGWPVAKWRCLLSYHHWPADPIAFGLCSKCLPCHDCGSETAGHAAQCPVVEWIS